MKTNFKSNQQNNVQKTVLRSAAVVVSFILISITVSGQDFWRKLLQTSHFDEIAMAMVATKKENKIPACHANNEAAFSFEKATDPVLKVEEWMFSNDFFEVAQDVNEVESETELKIQKWMLNENLFRVNNDYESPLEIDEWMISDKTWEI